MSDILSILAAVVVLLLMAFAFYKYFNALSARKKAATELDKPFKNPKPLKAPAVLIRKETAIKSVGLKYPKTENLFFVTFLVGGKEKKYRVNENFYAAARENTSGTLITVNGDFAAFEY